MLSPSVPEEVIILAGGLGTRLQTAVPDLPKCLAPINGRPFLDYLLTYLKGQQIKRFIFALGYRHEMIEQYIQSTYPGMDAVFSVEPALLGTGGAIRLAAKKAEQENVFIVNGDTFYQVDLKQLFCLHKEKQAACTLALKPMQDFDRYGSVELAPDQHIRQFHEKKKRKDGLINGGVYMLHLPSFLPLPWPEKFSFETDYLEAQVITGKIFGNVQDAYFIDIGIPDDFARASHELK